MKRITLVVVSFLITLCLYSQQEKTPLTQKIFDKVVLDIGVNPFSLTDSELLQFTSYNFGVGYQLSDRLDIRFNFDQFDFEDKFFAEDFPDEHLSERLWGVSLGGKYRVFDEIKGGVFNNNNLSIVGKFGFTMSPEYNEQESIFYDISARLYIRNLAYLGIGLNHQIEFLPFMEDDDIIFAYFTFGIDF